MSSIASLKAGGDLPHLDLLVTQKSTKEMNDIDQLTRIMSLVGTPGDELLAKIQSRDAQNYVRSLPRQDKKSFTQVLGNLSHDAVDLLEKMLVLDPDHRISVVGALEHQYLATFHDPDDEPTALPLDLSFEREDLATDRWRELVFAEIEDFAPRRAELDAEAEAELDVEAAAGAEGGME